MFQKLEAVKEKYEELSRLMSDPKVISNPSELQKYGKEQAEISELVDKYEAYKDVLKQIEEATALLRESKGEAEFQELARIEIEELEKKKGKLEDEIKLLLVPKDPYDEKNIFLEIRAGAGGDEAGLFAAELFRMYSRYAEKKRWKVEILDSNSTGVGGFKEIIALIEGKGAYSRLKYESGVHRVQRIPVTETGGRIHTSTVTVAVMPEAEDVEVHIDQKDLRIDTSCSSGPGGQSVNTTYSAIRITHIPSGIAVNCQDERSQLKNKNKAMRILRSRLMEIEREKQDAEIAQARKSQIGSGDRSEKIRTYNFPQNRVTDHRIGMSLYKLETVLDGGIDEFIDTLTTSDNAERLKNL
ncbi:MAG: peptide chain release factor 1 [Nitrospirota bacterium]